ncbi:MAG: methyltransferase domain-containing protein [Candidatus Binatia bacterium]
MSRPGSGADAWQHAAPEQIANRYYDATTWIYRQAWGSSFHFAPLRAHEPRRVAIRRFEEEVAAALGVSASSRCLDLGCGIGGPAATIAAATRARVVGLNANVGQLRQVARQRATVRDRPRLDLHAVGGDFARLPFGTATFDVAYAFEALCHAVDLEGVFREVHRVLRPGGTFGFSEWCLTEAFDPRDDAHRALARQIEASYGITELRSWRVWHEALASAGFRILRSTDRSSDDGAAAELEPRSSAEPKAATAADPWYRALQPRDRSLDSLARIPLVRALQAAALTVAERVRLAPAGTTETVRVLRAGTAALVAAGRRGIFTPMRLVVAARDAQ